MRFGKFFWGFLFLLIGILLLGLNAGWWSIDLWHFFAMFWPVLIILIGVRLIFRDSLISVILLFLIFAAAFLFAIDFRGIQQKANFGDGEATTLGQPFSSPLSDAKSGKMEINLGAASLDVANLADQPETAYVGTPSSNLRFNTRNDKSKDELSITLEEQAGWQFGNTRNRQFDLKLNQTIPWELIFRTGATQMNLNLENLRIKNLDINTGASSQTIRFGSLEQKIISNISAGASDLKIELPKDYSLFITSKTALSGNNFDSLGLEKNGNEYKSSGYDSADKQIELTISSGASSVQITKY